MNHPILTGTLITFLGITGCSLLHAQRAELAAERPDSVIFYSPDTQEREIVDIDDPYDFIDEADPIESIDDSYLTTADYNFENPGMFSNAGLFMREKTGLRQYKDKRIVLLTITTNQKETYMCSGAMVGKYAVLTAAHCLESPVAITIYAGGYPSSLKASATKVTYVQTIKKGIFSVKADLGIVYLDRPLGNQTGYFGAAAPTLAMGDTVFSSGFPSSLSLQYPWLSIGNVIADHDIPKPTINAGSFYFTAYAEPGMSGSPVFNTGDVTFIVAVQSSTSVISSVASGLGVIPTVIRKARQQTPAQNINEKIFLDNDSPSYHEI